jgi:hypothetical protein
MAKKNFSNDLLRDLHSESLSMEVVPNIEEQIALSALNTTEQARLNACETIIDKGFKTFVEVGNALFEIRNNKLYREKYSTFEGYCKDRWQLKRQRAYELMDAAEVVTDLSEISDKSVFIDVPTKESHAAALSKAPQELRNEVWTKVIEQNKNEGIAVTAKVIEMVISQSKGVNPENPAENQRSLLVKKMREKVKKATLSQISIEIKGQFLIENDLVSVWQALHNEATEINEDYKAYISLAQAEEIGLIRKA